MDEQNQQKQKSVITDKDFEIENMQEFLLENQDIKLENLPKYEDLIQPTTIQSTELDNMQEVNTLPFFETKLKPKVEPSVNKTAKKRFKIAVSCFAVVGALLMGLTLINGVALALATGQKTNNQKDITTLTQEVDELKYELDSTISGDAEKIRYKLALPRNYPDDTSELTWFDKLSIFLMKLFG